MRFNGFKSLLPKKFRGGGRKFYYLDGTPIESTGINRFLASPLVQMAGVAGVVLAGVQTLLAPGETQNVPFCLHAAIDAGCSLFIPLALTAMTRTFFDRRFAIDTSGYNGNHATLSSFITDRYQEMSWI